MAILVSFNLYSQEVSSDDPFAAIPDDVPSAEESVAQPSDKTILKIPTPNDQNTPQEETLEDSPLVINTPVKKNTSTSNETELLSNKDIPEKKEITASEKNEDTPVIEEPKKIKAVAKKTFSPAKKEKGALNSFDMENVGKSKKNKKQDRLIEQNAPIKIYGRDNDTGLVKDFDTKDDQGRFSLLYHANANLRKAQDLRTLEFIYGHKLSNNKIPLWAEFSFFNTTATFDTISSPNSSQNPSSLAAFNNSSESMWGAGAGIAIRSHWIRDFGASEHWSEGVGAHVYYLSLTENYFSQSYTGYGLKTHFSLDYRLSKRIQMGPQFGYYLATINRPKATNERSDVGALLITWTSLAFNFTYYFK